MKGDSLKNLHSVALASFGGTTAEESPQSAPAHGLGLPNGWTSIIRMVTLGRVWRGEACPSKPCLFPVANGCEFEGAFWSF
jgi:hypothetical protein